MLTIGKIAKRAGVSVDAIRHYEKEGLIHPSERSESGYRLYQEEVLKRLRFIKKAQHVGFSLSEIKELLDIKKQDNACCNDVRNLAMQKKLHIEHKIKALKEISYALDHFIEICDDSSRLVEACPILATLERWSHD